MQYLVEPLLLLLKDVDVNYNKTSRKQKKLFRECLAWTSCIVFVGVTSVFCFLVLTSLKIQKETWLLLLDRMMVLKGCKTTKSQRTCPSQNSWAFKKLQFMVADSALRTWIQDSTLRTSFVDPVSLDSRFKIRGEQTSWIQPPFSGSWILNPAPLDSRSFSGSWSLHPM